MTVKKLAGTLHLWLGLTTGLVVFILGITGAVYCFAPELQSLQPYREVPVEGGAFLPPSRIRQIAEKELPGKVLQRIYYEGRDRAVMTLFGKKEDYSYSVFINPYSGQVLKVRDNDRDVLSLVLKIHRTLNIPYGHDIIRWSTVIFVLMLLTGLVLWWPKNRRFTRGLKIMWRASPKRLNYDLHKVLGFYASWIALFSALTGLMFAFEGFADFTYRLTGYQHSIVQKKPPLSDTTMVAAATTAAPVDVVWKTFAPQLHGNYAGVMFVLPAAKSGPILVRANPEKSTLYKTDFRYFDQYSGREIPGAYVWGRYSDAHTVADNIRRMNYDWHTGAMFGLPGRIALFFVALIVASLPVTGFYFWWGRRKKKARRSRRSLLRVRGASVKG